MSLKTIQIQFIQCDSCGEHAPTVFDDEHTNPATEGQLAQDAAREQGWLSNSEKDLCPTCLHQPK